MVYTVENVFLMGQQLPPARAGGVGVMREIVLCCWRGQISPIKEDLLLPTGKAFICLGCWKLMRKEVGLSQRESHKDPCGKPWV